MSASNSKSRRAGVVAALLWIVATAIGACAPPAEVDDYCNEVCDCEECKDEDLEACHARTAGTLAIADAYDCRDEYLELLDCETSKGKCHDDTPGADPYFSGFECDANGRCSCENEQDDYTDCKKKASDADGDIIDV